MKCALSLVGHKINCIYLRKSDFSSLTVKVEIIMEIRFDMLLYFNLGNENSDAGHIKCLHGLQVPHPCCRGYKNKGVLLEKFIIYKTSQVYFTK